ncbi:MAG: SsrA-binding protein SmpB [Candidatus Gracilibacteria bacterium]|nr:SsrA-binding protein SmpB [Candidatus Gracilibacteria bacterium]
MATPSTIAQNKKALFDYEVLETFEAGIILNGGEVKSARAGGINLKGSHVSLASGRPILLAAHISPYKGETRGLAYGPTRDRELLLKHKDIVRLTQKIKEKGLTLVPTEFYFKGTLIKVKVALVRGRAAHDKRNVLKNRTLEKEARVAMRASI